MRRPDTVLMRARVPIGGRRVDVHREAHAGIAGSAATERPDRVAQVGVARARRPGKAAAAV